MRPAETVFIFVPIFILTLLGGAAAAGAQGAEEDCGTVIQTFKILPSQKNVPHVPVCSPVVYPTNPPTSGRHYPYWAQYKNYQSPVPHGFTVHNLEHGAIVISYNCPEGCEAEVAELTSLLAAAPTDPLCTAQAMRRIVVVPDPELDVRFAAAAWGASLKSNCFDLEALVEFANEFYGMGREDTCLDGVDLESPGLLPSNCGTPGSRIGSRFPE